MRDYELGEAAALALRNQLDLGSQPINNIWDLIRDLPINLAFHDFGDSAGDGIYEWDGETAVIVINSAQPPARQRFTAAHELGHHQMHRDDDEPLTVADKDVSQAHSPRERQANAFAGTFLAPTNGIRRDIDDLRRSPEPEDVVRLMRKYGLSYQATLYRLKNTGCISDSRRRRLQEEASGRVNWLMRVMDYSENDVFPQGPELPPEFVLSTARLFRDGAIGEERLAELLRSSKKHALARIADHEPDAADDPETKRIQELLSSA